MSDGISEGYRASRAAQDFETMWENAQIENLLLDMKREILHLSVEELVFKLTGMVRTLELSAYERFIMEFDNKTYFVQSVTVGQERGKAKRFCVSGSFSGIFKRFETSSMLESLRDALLFGEWIASDEGKRAIKVHEDW